MILWNAIAVKSASFRGLLPRSLNTARYSSAYVCLSSRNWKVVCDRHAQFFASDAVPEDRAKTSPVPTGLTDWKTIYRFNHILIARGIQRIKLYQTILTCGVFLPASVVSMFLEQTDVKIVYYCLGASIVACFMLGLMGTMASRLIGIMYVNEKDSSQLRIARLSFFGSRIDEYHPVSTFLPLTDSTEFLGDAYVVLDTVEEIESPVHPLLRDIVPENKYYLSLKYGTILDRDAFTGIFGDISKIKSKK